MDLAVKWNKSSNSIAFWICFMVYTTSYTTNHPTNRSNCIWVQTVGETCMWLSYS